MAAIETLPNAKRGSRVPFVTPVSARLLSAGFQRKQGRDSDRIGRRSGQAATARHQAGDRTRRNFRNDGLTRPKLNITPMGSNIHRRRAAPAPQRLNCHSPQMGSRTTKTSQPHPSCGPVRTVPTPMVCKVRRTPSSEPMDTFSEGQLSSRSIPVGSQGRYARSARTLSVRNTRG